MLSFLLIYVKFRESDIVFMLQRGDFNAQIDNWFDNLIVVLCGIHTKFSTSKTLSKMIHKVPEKNRNLN